MGGADSQGMLVLEGTAPQHRKQCVEISHQDVGRLRQLHRKAGVEHVARRHALMDKARIGADMLGEIGQKGDDVMVGLPLDLIDACDLRSSLLPGGAPRRRRDDAKRRLRVTGVRLDLEPDTETVLRLPDRAHRGAAIAGDHLSSCPCVIGSTAYSSARRGTTWESGMAGWPTRLAGAGGRAHTPLPV